jgi:phage terminase large subunit-like protein
LIEECGENGVFAVAFDPYNAQQLAEDLEREGITAARMAQNCGNFNEPIRDFLQALNDKRITHDGNPLLRWCANNAVLYKDRQDRWMFDKKSSAEKIDALVAVVMAFRMCCVAPTRASGSLFIS